MNVKVSEKQMCTSQGEVAPERSQMMGDPENCQQKTMATKRKLSWVCL